MEITSVVAFLLFFGTAHAFDFPENCGQVLVNSSKIVGGYDAKPGAFPWQAYLMWQGEFYCGATLIHPDWVLTASHCVYGYEDPADYYTIRFGELHTDVDEGTEVDVVVSGVFVHPDYDELNIDYDITLLKLSQPVEFTDYISPACFPSAEDDFPPGDMCIVSGWGSINPPGDEWGPMLKYENMELWSNEECNDHDAYHGQVTDRMLCAGFHLTGSDNEESCAVLGFGDSGGPLVCPQKESGNWTLVGAVSWEEFCNQHKYTPGVFARVQGMREWIVKTLEDNTF